MGWHFNATYGETSDFMKIRQKLIVTGIIQGVGFRPFVFKLAVELGLAGHVLNTGNGVCIDVEGDEATVAQFARDLIGKKPPQAVIDDVVIEEEGEPLGRESFEILKSDEVACDFGALIPPDSAICPDCLKELKDSEDFRYRYPFINCVNCGPRYTIIEKIPYDRPYTSMAPFEMCPDCAGEYKDPFDRRYHAQPISCPKCGPKLTLHRANGSLMAEGYAAIEGCAKLIKRGNILAIKGVGGFHLVCDASRNQSVQNLRDKKQRPEKPFAVMFKSVHDVMKCTDLKPEEEELLLSSERPIVLIQKRKTHRLEKFHFSCEGIAPHIDKVGAFLPYSPIHVLLLEQLKCPIVATSANISDEPIITDSEELREKLGGVFDYYLDYDREIVNPCDDSVVTLQDGGMQFIRKSRGYSPECLGLPFELNRKVLAVGAHLKNTISVAMGNKVMVSPHIGDMKGIETVNYFERNVEMFEGVYGFRPEVIVCDKHPHYASRKWAHEQNVPVLEVQHHYAHALALMGEHALNEKILCATWDGTGYGDDGTLWGGEFLTSSYEEYERTAYFEPFRLLGGEAAIKEPRRVALSLLFDLYGEEVFSMRHPLLEQFTVEEMRTLHQMYEKNLNAPLTSSVGRMFDAAAAISGLLYRTGFEGQGGMMMEAVYDCNPLIGYYPYEIEDGIIRHRQLFGLMLKEKDQVAAISKFINTLCHITADLAKRQNLPVGMSGGVFLNRILNDQTIALLKAEKIPYYIHRKLPPGDGCLSFGQVIYSQYH